MRYIRTTPNDIELIYTKNDFPLVFEYLGPDRTHGDGYYNEDKYAWYEVLKENNDLIYYNGMILGIICLSENLHLENSLNLSVIEVIKEQQGKSIGKTILGDLELFAKSYKTTMTLQARTESLKSYYTKLGYFETTINKCPVLMKYLRK